MSASPLQRKKRNATQSQQPSAPATINLTCTVCGRVCTANYRPPDNNLDLFRLGFNAVITIIKQSKTEYLLAGDYNIDLLKHDLHNH